MIDQIDEKILMEKIGRAGLFGQDRMSKLLTPLFIVGAERFPRETPFFKTKATYLFRRRLN